MTKLSYDRQGDAAFVYVSGPLAPGSIGRTKQLDQGRLIQFERDDLVLAYELLGVRRFGVRVDDLEHRDELRAIFRDAGIPSAIGARRSMASGGASCGAPLARAPRRASPAT